MKGAGGSLQLYQTIKKTYLNESEILFKVIQFLFLTLSLSFIIEYMYGGAREKEGITKLRRSQLNKQRENIFVLLKVKNGQKEKDSNYLNLF